MGERKPKIVYLPLRCSVEGCVRFPYVTVDGIPYTIYQDAEWVTQTRPAAVK